MSACVGWNVGYLSLSFAGYFYNTGPHNFYELNNISS